ncbi:LpqN/LpqT family lipoprotein [Oerskovia paurometabola]|uniref:LpqN/LpqT family lipoprotein n=1 Tax=Oerskovia paurometabola TaxID=162170 RepID=A0ABW1X6W3_9CELL|nr:LpqN/LpqT family lipoprotein [Oerskovia paurometabola]MBM7496394.1 hypothetical protein [Oerskovia paurometabola]
MPSTLQFPSEQFPAYPGVSLDQPDGWQPLPEVGLPLALAKDAAGGEFRANVITVLNRVRAEHTLDQAIGEVVARLTALPQYKELGRSEIDVQGHAGFRIEGIFAEPTLGALVQAVRIVLVDRGPVKDLVQVTGSCTGAQMPSTLPEIRAIQDSLSIAL